MQQRLRLQYFREVKNHASAAGASLASGSTSGGFQDGRHLVYLSLSGMAPVYLAVDCQLVSDEGRRQLRSATSRDACFQTDLQQL